ncbi:MAG: PEP-CTERM sorting domain-containing protein [Rhodocyclaceae bacterium]|nr:PEP-CTERM sorting domain-containing protein [Rhodocyclaceae bacterium]
MMVGEGRTGWALVMMPAPLAATAQVLETTGSWAGLDVTMRSPADKITFGTPFDVGFIVDSAALPDSSDFAAFKSTVHFSNTVDLSAAQWSYRLFSDDPAFNASFSGLVGDAIAPVSGSFALDLVDPFYLGRTFGGFGFSQLDGEFNDRIEWSITNIIIAGNTDFGLTLDDGGIVGVADFGASVLVIDPPPVPEPSILALALVGVGAIGWRARRAHHPRSRSRSA